MMADYIGPDQRQHGATCDSLVAVYKESISSQCPRPTDEDLDLIPRHLPTSPQRKTGQTRRRSFIAHLVSLLFSIHQCVLTDDECSSCAFGAFCALGVRLQGFGGCWPVQCFVEGCRSPLPSEFFETALNATRHRLERLQMIFSCTRQKMTIMRDTWRYLWSRL